MSEKKPFYITTPIFYPNAKLHLGHAYTTTLSDIIARYHRLVGDHVYFLTGSDENTQKMVDSAVKEGKEPLVFLDGIVENFASLYKGLDISYDQFIRTTDQKKHWPGAQALWQKLVAAGDIYKKAYEGLYCVGHEAFITEKDLVDGKCPDHGTVPEFIKEENYFFRLSKYAPQIQEKIETDEFRIVPESRKHEILSFIQNEGLEDVSFSRPRKAAWPQGLGIPVPGDDSQVMYVWCDALANYVTALGYGQDEVLYKEFWPANVHVIGKDILRFHAAIWPGMLLSAGVPLPKSLLVHGFITSGGKKMSKTLGNIIDPEELIEEYGGEAVRYFLARHITPFEDGDITRESFKEIYNANLANGLGNLSARIMTLAEKHLDVGTRPEPAGFEEEYTHALESFEVHKALDFVFTKVQALDRTITETEPFKLIKTEPEQAKKIIFDLTQELYSIARMLNPFMPETSEKIKAAVVANKKPENLFARKD
ncbi:MAG: class I tRNA ligase family protein [Candidatus Adlerbacteria bacterium]|nr:class I tRNA ligase family protein [Candidatus Adlerbacteria bacterium]